MTDSKHPLSLFQAYRFCSRCGAARDSASLSAEGSEKIQTSYKCLSCRFVQHFNPISAVGLILVDTSNSVLLIRRERDPGKGKLGLPGGFIDISETAEQAARREIKEEIGIEVGSMKFVVTYPNSYVYQNITIPVLDIFMTAIIDSNETFKLAADEVDEVIWHQIDEATLHEMAFVSNANALRYYLTNRVLL